VKAKLIDWLGVFVIWIVSRVFAWTARVEVIGAEHRAAAAKLHPAGAYIFATWHENAFSGMSLHARQKFAVLCSLSRDGEYVARVARFLGLRAVRGSSSRGGLEARNAMLETISSGWSPAITVDGPRGPRRIVKAGVIDVARKSGAWIIPMAAIPDSAWVMKRSWDKFRLPKPFTRVLLVYRPPIHVPTETSTAEFEAARNAVEQELLAIEAMAEARPRP